MNKNNQIITVAAFTLIGFPLMSVPAAAQAPARTPTYAELQRKLTQLERELADTQRDYQLLLTTCTATAATPGRSATTDPANSSERLEQAAITLQNAQANLDYRLEQIREHKRLDDDMWRVKTVDYAITETNRVFTRFGWKVTIMNGLDQTQGFDLTIQFLDKDGFVVDTARKYGATVRAFDETTITGDALITLPGAFRVASVKAVATRRG